MQLAGLVVYSRVDSVPGGVDGAKDVVASETLRFGGMPPEHGRMIVSTMGLDLIGANYKYIAGYPSSGNIRAAIMSGEVNTATDASHAYLNQVVPVIVDEGHAVPLFGMPMFNGDGELVQNKMVPDVPSLPDLYESLNGEPPSGIVWESIVTMLELDQTMQHVFLGPPEMQSAAANTFREGLQKAMTSEAFLEEARRVLSYVPDVVDYQRQAEILGATEDVPPEVLEYIKAHIEKNSSY